MLRRAYAHAKGLGTLLGLIGSFVAIMAIYTYLSAIDRLDLFLPSISIGPALFIWLFFVILLCVAFLLCIATPSALFGMLLTIFGLSDKDGALIGLGEAIRARRKATGLSQEAMSDKSEIDRSHYGKIERGERNVTLLNVLKIAAAIGCKPSDLLIDAGL
jgi:DNA-binding XRE family transcriptional regulator